MSFRVSDNRSFSPARNSFPVFYTGSLHVYTLQDRSDGPADKIPAEHLKGVVIEGEVLQTKGEVLRLHLEIDDSQDVSAAYDYPWRPITGNMLYCMPEKGTRAALYFDKDNEENAKAIYNLRENGEQCPELADPVDRYFTTDCRHLGSCRKIAGTPDRVKSIAQVDHRRFHHIFFDQRSFFRSSHRDVQFYERAR